MANQQQASVLKGLPSARPSSNVGEYVIVAELARGGMGCVYLARRGGQAGFERHFAIKVMHHNLSNDQDALSMLLDEAHIASRLHHPNVVSVLDIGMADGGYYLVMDYVEGCSLQELMQRNRESRPARKIVPIMIEALHGLHAVHSLKNPQGEPYGVVHRDVSPHNLLVGLDGGCRVTDFGIAKASERFTDTQAGVFKGKLAYMAPEQLRDLGDLDCRADVWSAGVTLYAALTNRHPFRGPNDAATLHGILTADITPPSEVGLKPPACLDAVVMKALARDRDERWPSAQAFGEALRKVALENDLLGAPSEIASWVEETFGKELTERRKKIRSAVAVEREAMTESGRVPVVPRLWNPQEEEVSSKSAQRPLLIEPPVLEPEKRSRGKMLVFATIAGFAFGIGALGFDWFGSRDVAPAATTATVTAPAAPAPRAAAPAPTPAPAEIVAPTAAAAPSVEAPAVEPESETTSRSARARARAGMNERAAQAIEEPRPAPVQSAPAQEARPSPAPAPAPAPAAPAEAPRRTLERNPYLSGE